MGRGPGFPEGSRCPQVVESRLPLSSPMEVPGGGQAFQRLFQPLFREPPGQAGHPHRKQVSRGPRRRDRCGRRGQGSWRSLCEGVPGLGAARALPSFPQLVGSADGLGLNLSGSRGGRWEGGAPRRFQCCWNEVGRERRRCLSFHSDCGSSDVNLVPSLRRVHTWFLRRCDFSKGFMKTGAF